MNEKLSAEQVQSYREHGILFPIRVLDAAATTAFQAAFDSMELHEGPLKYLPHPHLFFPWAHELAIHPTVIQAVEEIIGPELLVESTVILAKYPADGLFVPWHQDGEYSGWYKTPSVSAWIALTDSDRQNGCMRVIPGSHRRRQPHRQRIYPNSLFQRTTEIEVKVDEDLASDVELKAGEFSLHHSSIIHGSSPNRSNTRRVGFVVRFVTPAFQSRVHQHPVVRARGTGDCGLLPLLAAPPSGELEECWASWRAAFPLSSHAYLNQSTTEATGERQGR